ncbi:acyl-CoA N-acyltransferase [Pyronema domesticum]|nr:acyl-CoA N-acyltransferase [Pyronema domesticum]
MEASDPSETTPLLPNHKSDPPFHLRPARLSDITQLSSLAASAYLNSGLTLYRSPLAHTYLPDYLHSFYLRLLSKLLNPRTITLVAYTTSIDPPNLFNPDGPGYKGPVSDSEPKTTEHIIGTLAYSIPPSHPTPASSHPFFPRLYHRLYHLFSSYFFTDRSLHPFRAPHFLNTCNPAGKFIGDNNYYIQTLAVSPAWQRRGVGREMMRGLLEAAGGEGREVWLEASPTGERLYEALGFRIEERFWEEFDVGERGGGVMGWRPPRREVAGDR